MIVFYFYIMLLILYWLIYNLTIKMISKVELFKLDLRVHKQIVRLKIYQSDTLDEVIQRISEIITQGKEHRDKLKAKLLDSIKATLRNQKMQSKIREKLNSLLESDSTILNGLQTDRKVASPTETPFKLLQQNMLSSKEKERSKSKKHFNYLPESQEPTLKYVPNYKDSSNSSQMMTRQFNENQSSYLQREAKSFVRSPEKEPLSSLLNREHRHKHEKSQDLRAYDDKLVMNYTSIGSDRKYIRSEIPPQKNNQRQIKQEDYRRLNQQNQGLYRTKDYESVSLKRKYEFDHRNKYERSKEQSKDDTSNRAYQRKYSQFGISHDPTALRKADGSETFQQYRLNRNKSQSLVNNSNVNGRSNKNGIEILKEQKINTSVNYPRPKNLASQKYNYEAVSTQPQKISYVGSINKLGNRYNYLGSENLYPSCI